MASAQSLIDNYKANTWLIHRLVDGISHDESLLQLPYETNNLNWILGHIVWRRNSALAMLGGESVWNEAEAAPYRTGSERLTDAQMAHDFATLLRDLDETERRLVAALEAAAVADLEQVVETDRGARPVQQHLAGLHWHETYHVGQMELLKAFVLSRRAPS